MEANDAAKAVLRGLFKSHGAREPESIDSRGNAYGKNLVRRALADMIEEGEAEIRIGYGNKIEYRLVQEDEE